MNMNYIRYINNPYPNIKRGVGKGKGSVGEGEERVVEGGICAIGYRGNPTEERPVKEHTPGVIFTCIGALGAPSRTGPHWHR